MLREWLYDLTAKNTLNKKVVWRKVFYNTFDFQVPVPKNDRVGIL